MMSIAAPQDLHLSSTEWQAVSVALADAAGCGCAVATAEPGGLTRLFRSITGARPRMPLADPRLEAVRRFVCETSRFRRLPEARVPELLDHGFNRQQIDALAVLSA